MNGNFGCLVPEFLSGDDRAADYAMTEIAVEIAKYWCIGSFAQQGQCTISLIRHPMHVHPDTCVKDGRVRRESPCTPHHFLKRQIIEPFERGPARKRLKCLTHRLNPKPFQR